jgi:hypothetical protein
MELLYAGALVERIRLIADAAGCLARGSASRTLTCIKARRVKAAVA